MSLRGMNKFDLVKELKTDCFKLTNKVCAFLSHSGTVEQLVYQIQFNSERQTSCSLAQHPQPANQNRLLPASFQEACVVMSTPETTLSRPSPVTWLPDM